METDIKCNVLKGTAVAGVSDVYKNSLQVYLAENYFSYDAARYECKGFSFGIGGQSLNPNAHVAFLCWDKVESKYVRMEFNRKFSLREAFSLFTEFEIVVGETDGMTVEDCETLVLEG